MADSLYKIEDEVFPSFLYQSLDSTSGQATLENVTLGSGPGLPVAASTVAKIRPASDNRCDMPLFYDDIDLNNLPEDELDQYFNKLVPPDMQRGRVEGLFLSFQGAKNGNSVVYQNEQGQWVTDLAYYSSFEKEVGNKATENNLKEFQDECFAAPGLYFNLKFIFSEEKMEPAPTNTTFQSDSSWKVPSSSYILMRASQVSDLSQADQSYLRLSLGQFFEHRSEALGCLGRRGSADDIKRPSFGYVITSPEKREPFALIHPSELADASTHNATVDVEDTLAAPNHSEGSDVENQSNLMLSISTIASAIADASISTDPSQLAAMIMELSKRRKAEPRPVGANTAYQPKVDDHVNLNTLQKSVFDMDKYLKKTELSDGSEASLGQTTFDLTGWAAHLNASLYTAQKESSDHIASQINQATSDNMSGKACTTSNSISNNNSASKRSSIPRPSLSYSSRTSCERSGLSFTRNPQETEVSAKEKHLNENGDRMLAVKPQSSNIPRPSSDKLHNRLKSPVCSPVGSPDIPRSPAGLRRGPAGLPSPNGDFKSTQKSKRQEQPEGLRNCPSLKSAIATPFPSTVEKHVGFTCPSVQSSITVLHLDPFVFPGQVVVPEELRFTNACCVGIASQTSLSLYNPSERWQQVSIRLTSLSIDGEKADILPYQWLIVKNKTIIGPKTTEDQKVLFIPPQPGVYQCVLSVCSWPASAESDMAATANLFSKRVVLVAIAENPAIEIELGKAGCLDFGDLPVGGAKSLALKLLSRTHATVPIRLVLSANATAWPCFSLSKNPVTMTCEVTHQAGHITSMSPQAVMNHVMHASYGECNLYFYTTFMKISIQTCYQLGTPDEFVARVDVEVDSPGRTHLIRSIPLRARSGTARVHAPKDLQTLSLAAPVGKSSQQMLPLKNAGNIDVQLKLKCSGAEGCFSVTPNELCLKVGEEQSIVISFKAQENSKAKESLLTILVLPSGPQYEVTLKGEVAKGNSGKQAISSSSVQEPGLANDIPPILSNKQFVAWGGVTLGRAIQQKLVLRNNSKTETQQLRLLIRGQDQDCFQLQSMFSLEERLTRHGELSIRPTEDVTVHLLFAPTRVACMLAKLEIKQSGVRPSQPGIKFTIPLSGYGGTSNIILEDQRKQADGYVATVTDVAVGRVSKVCVCVRNTGSRAAFIKAVAYSDLQKRATLEASVISISPSQFVLKERTQEVGRMNYLRYTFSIEYDLPLWPNEAHLFYGNMSKVVVSLMGSTNGMEPVENSHSDESLPSSRRSSASDRYFVHLHWLNYYGPSATSTVQIRNHTSRDLSFDLSWPAHCLTITPQHGVIEPQCHLQILISPNPSLANKSSLLPWSGKIYVQCDGQQKLIKVQIRQDLVLDVSVATGDSTLSALAPQAATPVVHLPRGPTKPLTSTEPSPELVKIKHKAIVFPVTPSGETSEAQLEVENGDVDLRWYLSSFAPPYVKGVDTSGDVYRATYAAFRCSRVSGTLGAHEKMQVPITFLPRDRGDFVQFWDLECHPLSEPQQKTSIRFQLCGTVRILEAFPLLSAVTLVILSAEDGVRRGVYSPQDLYTFPATRVGESSSLKVNIRNNSADTHELKFVSPREPFHIKHSKYPLRSQHFMRVPVHFKPSTPGSHAGVLLIQSDTSGSLVIHLAAEAH
uniref:Centrosomal protein 192 n=1 Tax=Neogobius melanostomus TaxID=47308 RepID=A0A8C6TZN8_9GOBI